MWPPGYTRLLPQTPEPRWHWCFPLSFLLTRSSLLVRIIRFKKRLSSLHHPLGCEGSGSAFSQQMIWAPTVYQTLFYIHGETAFRQEVTPLALKKLAFKRIIKHFLDASLWPQAPLVAQMVKNPPSVREIWIRSLGWEDPLEEGMETHSSILAWTIPWTEEPGKLQSMGSQRVRYDWTTKHSTALWPGGDLVRRDTTVRFTVEIHKFRAGLSLVSFFSSSTEFLLFLHSLLTST